MTELLSCPFCGSGPAIPFGRGPGQASFSGVELMRGARGRRYVQCGTCGAQSLCSFHEGAAISNWNTRTAAEAANREEAERLREALKRIATVDMGGGFLGAQACREVARAALSPTATGEGGNG